MNDDYSNASPQGTNTVKTEQEASILRPYSIGSAAANIQVGQTTLEVFPSEKLPYTDGEVTDAVSTYTTTGVDSKGSHYSNSVKSSNAITAKWLSRDPWLKFPGLVRRGELVQIWRLGDTDQYYWELLGTTNHLRRRDILLLVISNTIDESVTELTPENSYFFEFNTVDKHITLSTNDNDGEACRYVVQLNTKDGNFSISDSVGNAILLDSLKELIMLKNTANSHVTLAKTKITIEALDSILIRTKLLDVQTQETKMTGNKFSGEYSETTWQGSQYSGNYSQMTLNGSALTVSYSNFGVSQSGVDFNVGSIKHQGKEIGSSHTHNKVKGGDETSGSVT